MEYVYFQFYRAHPDGVIWKKLTIDDKCINNGVSLFIHQTIFVSSVEKKNCYDVNEVHTSAKWEFNYFQKLCS